MRQDFRETIYKLKVTLVAVASFIIGFGLLVLAGYAAEQPELEWVAFWQIGNIGGTLLAAGLFGIVWDYVDGKDKEARDTERLHRVLSDAAPEIRDAVVEGFAVKPDDLKRVATPELLDSIAANALALRLGDEQFATEIYKDLRDNAIRAPERWFDCDVRVRLSSIEESTTSGSARVAHVPALPRFDVTVTWEYTVVPSSPIHRFACTSDPEEFHDLISDIPSTSTWFMTPSPGLHANERESYELLQYSVDGEERAIRRSERKSGQTYSVTVGEDVVAAGKPVRIRHVYRTVVTKSGHWLMIALAQPTKNLSLTLDYTNTDIASIRVSELVSSARRPHVSRLPIQAPGKEVTIDVDGWVLPSSEVSFVWTLVSESTTGSEDAPTADARSSRAA